MYIIMYTNRNVFAHLFSFFILNEQKINYLTMYLVTQIQHMRYLNYSTTTTTEGWVPLNVVALTMKHLFNLKHPVYSNTSGNK